jgi:Skp family chaperone for outer membrane proteins
MHDLNNLKKKYLSQLASDGVGNSNKAKTFEDYVAGYESDPVPSCAKHLQNKVGGEFARARAAFNILSEESAPIVIERPKPTWFSNLEQQCFESTQKAMDYLWKQTDGEIQALAQSRSKIAEGNAEKALQETKELLEVINELEVSLTNKDTEISNKRDEIKRLFEFEKEAIRLGTENRLLAERIKELELKLEKSTTDSHQVDILKFENQMLTKQLSESKNHADELKDIIKSINDINSSSNKLSCSDAKIMAEGIVKKIDNIDSN